MSKELTQKRAQWSDKTQIPKCQECGQQLPYSRCGDCKHFFFARTIEQTLMQIPMCSKRRNKVTCIILDEDLWKPVDCSEYEPIGGGE